MAIVVDRDSTGMYATLTCHWRGCQAHVSARPAGQPDEIALAELPAVVADWAEEDGWLVAGHGWCPQHRARASRTPQAARRLVGAPS